MISSLSQHISRLCRPDSVPDLLRHEPGGRNTKNHTQQKRTLDDTDKKSSEPIEATKHDKSQGCGNHIADNMGTNSGNQQYDDKSKERRQM